MIMSQDTCLLRVHTINLRGIGGGMLTKQNALFVTVRQTPKVHERVHHRTHSIYFGFVWHCVKKKVNVKDFLKE